MEEVVKSKDLSAHAT